MESVPAREARLSPLLRAAARQGRLDDPRPLAVAAQIGVALQAALQIALGVASWTGSGLVRPLTLVTLPVFLGAAVLFLCWVQCCRVNAETFAPGTHKYGVGQAVWVWLIPVIMWWRPYRVVQDIRRATDWPGGAQLVNAWWLAWIGKQFAFGVYVLLDPLGNPNALPFSLANGLAAVLAVLVIQRLTTAQRTRLTAR
ncbi:hypothetical protein CFP65_6162 [Kitasatospora sp. MMS16-BH015]|uniref:DUF4328 domain-containing protein n=1 Tax=Kitasatospora sp. MMS16-BH015 TaxID=2018025 RepID=UPI000CA29D94|nr:DUF4328 domain-containing protein [Kitasatospora sp. MMS16-BH015]AUG80829.1 hypothetical protein CFP65_6162 [Kitasatospora sp. MMS16-BH015]